MLSIMAIGAEPQNPIEETWGHLKPIHGRKYFGKMLIAVGAYGDKIFVETDFPGLEVSPWQYEHFQDFLFNRTKDFDVGIYVFDGWYKLFKNGNYRIGGGKFQRITLDSSK